MRHTLTPASATPSAGSNNTANQHCATEFESLPRDLKAKLIKPTERGQTRVSEGHGNHGGAFRLDSERISILGITRPLHRE